MNTPKVKLEVRVLNVFMFQWFKKANPTAATLSRKTPPYCLIMLHFKIEAPEGFRLQSVRLCSQYIDTLFHFSLRPKRRTIGNQKVNMCENIFITKGICFTWYLRNSIFIIPYRYFAVSHATLMN